jgi:hypothetical protein
MLQCRLMEIELECEKDKLFSEQNQNVFNMYSFLLHSINNAHFKNNQPRIVADDDIGSDILVSSKCFYSVCHFNICERFFHYF